MSAERPTLPVRCLSEDEVLDFAAGRLSHAERDQAHAHLDTCEPCRVVLGEAVRALSSTATAPDLAAPAWGTMFRPGSLIGARYEVRRFIQRGGMGEVYEAFDQVLQERVALKTVTATSCDDERAVRRLKAEVQLARRVSHPNVCRIYDFGTHSAPGSATPTSFLTMEFVDGETLGARLRRAGALPISEVRRLARQLLKALSAAHEAGVLHRDFKSDNVMLREDEAGLTAVILDFGLARALDQASHESSSTHRSLVGTLPYVAPEQLQGKPHTPASDVYSFGVVCFEMLTGQLPFVGGAFAERLTRDSVLPSSKNAEVPSDLDSLVARCLKRDPALRFASAAAVLSALTGGDAKRGNARRFPLLVAAALALPLLVGASTLPTHGSTVSALRAQLPIASQLLGATFAKLGRPPGTSALIVATSLPASVRSPARPRPSRPKLPPSPAASSAPGVESSAPVPTPWENPFRVPEVAMERCSPTSAGSCPDAQKHRVSEMP